jgi:uncharacterized membrane protein YqjE
VAEPLREPGPAAGLIQSAVRLGGSLLGVLQIRGELLTTEVDEEIQRGARVLLLGFATLLASILVVLVAGFVIVIVFWDTHRIAAALGVLAVFVLTAAGCGLALRREVKTRPRFLGASRDEIARDIEQLRERL